MDDFPDWLFPRDSCCPPAEDDDEDEDERVDYWYLFRAKYTFLRYTT